LAAPFRAAGLALAGLALAGLVLAGLADTLRAAVAEAAAAFVLLTATTVPVLEAGLAEAATGLRAGLATGFGAGLEGLRRGGAAGLALAFAGFEDFGAGFAARTDFAALFALRPLVDWAVAFIWCPLSAHPGYRDPGSPSQGSFPHDKDLPAAVAARPALTCWGAPRTSVHGGTLFPIPLKR
jgi:hypothetical protein